MSSVFVSTSRRQAAVLAHEKMTAEMLGSLHALPDNVDEGYWELYKKSLGIPDSISKLSLTDVRALMAKGMPPKVECGPPSSSVTPVPTVPPVTKMEIDDQQQQQHHQHHHQQHHQQHHAVHHTAGSVKSEPPSSGSPGLTSEPDVADGRASANGSRSPHSVKKESSSDGDVPMPAARPDPSHTPYLEERRSLSPRSVEDRRSPTSSKFPSIPKVKLILGTCRTSK